MTTLTEQWSFGIKPAPAVVRSYQVGYSAQNSSYTGSQSTTVRIDIGQVANAWVDPKNSYLKYTITIGAQDSELDAGCWSVINSIEVYGAQQSSLLDSVQNANLLYQELYDVTATVADMQYAMSPILGTSDANARRGRTIATNGSLTVCLPLIGVLGLGVDKHMPMLGYTILIRLENPETALISAGATYTISDVEYVATIHELSPEVHNMVMASNGPQLLIPAVSYRTFRSTIPQDVRSASIPIGVRVSSMKAILATVRNSAHVTTTTEHSLSNRLRSYINSFQVRVGSTFLPQRPLTNSAQWASELQKAFDVLHLSSPGQISSTTYERDVRGAAATDKGSFLLGLTTEPAIRNKSDSMLGGLSTLNNIQTFVDFLFSANHVALTFDCQVMYDILLAVQGGAITAQF